MNNESQEKLLSYAKEQEKLYVEFVSVHQKMDDFIHVLNKEAQTYIENGNSFKQELFLGARGKREIIGDGYFDGNRYPLYYFSDNSASIMEAHNLFRDRIVDKYKRLFGNIEVFSLLTLDYDDARSKKVYLAEDILNWLEDTKNGVTLQQYFSDYEFTIKNKTVSYLYLKWDKDEDGGDRLYSPSYYKELFGALQFVEFGNTNYKETYADLSHELSYMTKDGIKQPFSIEDSQMVESIRFFPNGKIDIHFSDKELAKSFYDFVLTKKEISTMEK